MKVFNLPPLTVDGTPFSQIKLERLDCPHGVSSIGMAEYRKLSCQPHPCGQSPVQGPFRITLSNAALKHVYELYQDRVDHYVYDKKNPNVDTEGRLDFVDGRSVPLIHPNARAFAAQTNEHIQTNPFNIDGLISVCAGDKQDVIERRLNSLDQRITVLYDAARARATAEEDRLMR